MVDGERHLVADDLAHLGDVLLQQVEALLGEVQAGEGVDDVVDVVAGVSRAPLLERASTGLRSACTGSLPAIRSARRRRPARA